ncbi:MAG: hypothetical protein KGL58_00415 [Pseudomonadota bacterium]|nr:hypothetical protein [Pseudomonadota bacterium]
MTLMLAACTNRPALPMASPVVHEPSGIIRPVVQSSGRAVLAFYRHTRTLSKPALAREISYMTDLLQKEPTDSLRVELAMLDLMPSRADVDQAQIVLRPMIGRDTGTELGSLAYLLNDYAGSMKDSMRRLHDEQKRNKVLAGKLNALKNLEIHLMEPGH